MKKIMACAIMALLVVGSTVVFATPDDPKNLKNVNTNFQSGVGMQLLVTNRNDHTIYDVTLEMDTLDIYGGSAMLIGTVPRATTINELAPGESGVLNVFTFGLPGVYSVVGKISYDINELTLTQAITGTLLIFGFFTFVIDA